jgi:hypothetical protein
MPTRSKRPLPKLSEAQTFLSNLKGGKEFPLKHIARALYHATGGRQEALLTLLKKGEIIASAYWPTAAALTGLPVSLWAEIQPNKFRVRYKQDGSWHTSTYSFPSWTLLRHLALPHILRISDKSLPSADKEHLLSEVVDMLSARGESANVCVTLTNARAYTEKYLASAQSTKKVGRPKILDSNLLLLEAMRRLYLHTPLPSQKRFVADLADWWNSDLSRGACSTHWVEKHVKEIWATLKQP